MNNNPDMLAEYDFSNGVRGKYAAQYPKSSHIIRLDDDVQHTLQTQAQTKGVDLSELVNTLLRQDIALLETEK